MKRLLLALMVVAWSPRAFALNPSLDISQYAHTAWKIRDGFVTDAIRAIAQTSDGYLWLGTDRGLFRFDGVRTVRWQSRDQALPSNTVTNLLGARDGTLWIGTSRGLARWNGRALTRYEQLAQRVIGSIIEDRAGVVWIANWRSDLGWGYPCRGEGDRVECGGPDISVLNLFADGRGNVWGAGMDSVWRLKPEPRVVHRLGGAIDARPMTDDVDGALLISWSGGVARVVDDRTELRYPLPAGLPSSGPQALLHDKQGGLWFGTSTSGLVHVHEGITDVYAEADGLSGDVIDALFEDREGSIWVATNSGLDRFRDAAAATVRGRQGLLNMQTWAVAAARDGNVWATGVAALHNLASNTVTIYREPRTQRDRTSTVQASRPVHEIAAAWADHLTAVFQDRAGRMWVGLRSGVGFLENGRFVPVGGVSGTITRAIVEDRDRLWVANDQTGLFAVSPDGRRATSIPRTALNRQDVISAATADPNGIGVWLGFLNGGIVFFDGSRVQGSYGAPEGLGAGAIHQLVLDDGAVWAATEGGLSRVKDRRVATLTRRHGLPCDMILWLVEDDDRALWVSTECGLIRIARDEIDRWIESGASVHPRPFGATDGVRTFATFFAYTAPAVKSTDGRLWFVSTDGIGVIDPHQLPMNTRPPPVVIERLAADRKEYDIPSSTALMRLPALVRELQIDYTALSLVASEQNQFRYRLEGYDADWQDPGNRRQAFYTNLPPKNYRFHVIASNNSGVWNETGATLDFVIPPAYYQTNWFIAIVAAMLFALVWTAHRVRLRIVERHQREISALNERLMKAQEQERIRIAGELHDGVMQQMLGVTMMLGTAKRKIATNPAEAEASIGKIQQKLIQTGTDIRQLSHGLHPPLLQDEGLPGALRSYCDQFGGASNIPVTCDVDDSARDLSRGAALALFRITQEALGNAAKHAKAKHVTVTLKRANGTIALTISDDGVGFDRSQLGTSGGLGLVMMRERAGQLNGTFDFESAPGRGTTIRVVIPFR